MTDEEIDAMLDEHEDELNTVVCDAWADMTWSEDCRGEFATKEVLAAWLKQQMDAGALVVDCDCDDPKKATANTRWRLISTNKPPPPWDSNH